MRPHDQADTLRRVGLTPTIQRLAILDYLQASGCHPTADETLSAVREQFPSISRATVYNTLDSLTKVGIILRLAIDPAVARYDADLDRHAHFRCRICNRVYDINAPEEGSMFENVDGHRVESIRTYAYGICATCLANESPQEKRVAQNPTDTNQAQKRSETSSATYSHDPKGGE